MKKLSIVSLLLFINISISYSDIVINEISAVNGKTLHTADYETPDWIELYNNSDSYVNLKGWRISDRNDFDKAYVLPDIDLAPASHLTLYADDAPPDPPSRIVHCSGDDAMCTELFDSYHYKYTELSGDCEIEFQLRYMQNASIVSMAGILIKADNNPDCPMAGVFSSGERRGTPITMFQLGGGQPQCDYPSHFIVYPDMNVKLKKDGDSIWFYAALKGEVYEQVGAAEVPGLGQNYMAGLAFAMGESTGEVDIVYNNFIINGQPANYSNISETDYNCRTETTTKLLREYYTGFGLSSQGETIYLWGPDADLIDEFSFERQYSDISIGRIPDGSTTLKMMHPATPGSENTNEWDGISAQPEFSEKGGFCLTPVQIWISGPGEIHYTTNGAPPDINSPVWSGQPLSIADNMVLRAIQFEEGKLPSLIETHTYIFDEETKLPIFSLACDSLELWDPQTGIFIHSNLCQKREIPVHFEYWESRNGPLIYSSDAGSKLAGQVSLVKPQKSMKLIARGLYNNNKYEHDFFGTSSLESGYDKLVLRNGGNDNDLAFIRDVYTSAIVKDLPYVDYAAYEPCIMYLNARYWGKFHLRERLDEDYLREKYYISEESINLMGHKRVLHHGKMQGWVTMVDSLLNYDMRNEGAYEFLDRNIDIYNLIDYTSSQLFSCNMDWPWNNLKCWQSDEIDKRWRWLPYDLDWTYGFMGSLPKTNSTKTVLHPHNTEFGAIFHHCMKNTKFKNQFLSRFADLMNTTFHKDRTERILDSLINDMEDEMPRQQKRWDRTMSEWEGHIGQIRNFIRERAPEQFKHTVEWYKLEGSYKIKIQTNIANAGKIEVNTIELAPPEDELLDWQGEYFSAIPIHIVAIPRNGYQFAGWSDPDLPAMPDITLLPDKDLIVKAIFEPTGHNVKPLVINEILYKPADDKDCGDWIELYNPNNTQVDLSDYMLRDDNPAHSFVFPAGTKIAGDGYLVIVKDSNDFREVYGDNIITAGECDFGFGGQDQVLLFDNFKLLMDSLSYANVEPWPLGADGSGRSIELRKPSADNELPENWVACILDWGTPGEINSTFISVSDLTDLNNGNIYPNPASGKCLIKSNTPFNNQISVVCYDIFGISRLLEYEQLGPDLVEININTLSAGAYTVIINSGNGIIIYTDRLIVLPK